MAARRWAWWVSAGIALFAVSVNRMAYPDANPTAVVNPATLPGATSNGTPNGDGPSGVAGNSAPGNGSDAGNAAATGTAVIVGKETGNSTPNPPTISTRNPHSFDAPTSLQNAMNQMLDLDFAVKKEYADPGNIDQTLRDIALFERDVAYCKLHLAPSVNKLQGEDKITETDSYRVMMSSMMRTLLDLEDAVHDKKMDDAKKLLATIDEIEEQGHAEFIPP
jgi:hypothetical protein